MALIESVVDISVGQTESSKHKEKLGLHWRPPKKLFCEYISAPSTIIHFQYCHAAVISVYGDIFDAPDS